MNCLHIFFYLCKHERKINTFYGGNILFLKINNCSILSFFNYISFIFQLVVGSQYWRLQDSNSLFMLVQNMNLKNFTSYQLAPVSMNYKKQAKQKIDNLNQYMAHQYIKSKIFEVSSNFKWNCTDYLNVIQNFLPTYGYKQHD